MRGIPRGGDRRVCEMLVYNKKARFVASFFVTRAGFKPATF